MNRQPEKIAIDDEEKIRYARTSHHRELDYFDLACASRDLFGCREWCYNATISQNFSAEELIYYPQLAQALMALPEYPEISRAYAINPETFERGVALLRQLAEFASSKEALFNADYNALENKVTELVAEHGQLRYLPLIDKVLSKEVNYWSNNDARTTIITGLVISGITWDLESKDEERAFKNLCWRKLFNLSNKIGVIRLEEVEIGTPFVGLRLKANWRAKGHIQWYSLDTRQPVKKADKAAWQKLHQVK